MLALNSVHILQLYYQQMSSALSQYWHFLAPNSGTIIKKWPLLQALF